MSIRLPPGSLLVSKFYSLLRRPFWGCFIPQRRVPFMERPGGSHWLECSHHLVLLVSKFYSLLRRPFWGRFIRWMDGRRIYLRRIYLSIFILEKTRGIFFLFFQMSLAIRGNIFFYCQQAKNRARMSKMDSKIDTLDGWMAYLPLAYLSLAYLPFHNFLGKTRGFYFFFSNVFSYKGEQF